MYNALASFDVQTLRELLSVEHHLRSKEGPGTVLHDVLQTVPKSRILRCPQRRQIMYMLFNAGMDVNAQDEVGNSLLHVSLLHVDGDAELCEPLLQCGADTRCKNQNGDSSEDLLEDLSSIPHSTKDLFKKYSPGLWYAVEADDLMCVRKLVNLWCKGNLTKNGKTLRQLTFEKGTEHIIRLIKDIEPSTKLAHAVLAGDTNAVHTLCTAQEDVNVEFRNRGDMGATPLFYAIMQNNPHMIEVLMSKGAKIDTTITFQDEEIPIYFAALNKESDPEVIKMLTPKRNIAFLSLQYRGNNVLFHCIENHVHPNAVKHILQKGYPELVAARNQQNLCGRELAEKHGYDMYVSIIDEVVHEWALDADNQHRKTLALLGYTYMREAKKDGIKVSEVLESMETSSDQAKFDTQLYTYQSQVQQLIEAIDNGDAAGVKALVLYNGKHPQCFHACLAEARGKKDGQPVLIKAVLRSQLAIVEHLCDALLEQQIKQQRQQRTMKKQADNQQPSAVQSPRRTGVDNERDAWYRTALHYAYGMEGSKHAVAALMQFGASEFSLDKDDRSPLVFKDYCHNTQMHELIRYHIKQDYSHPEPDPFQNRPKIRLANCQNHHHGDHQHHHQQQPQQQQQQQPQTAPIKEDITAPTSSHSYCVIL